MPEHSGFVSVVLIYRCGGSVGIVSIQINLDAPTSRFIPWVITFGTPERA